VLPLRLQVPPRGPVKVCLELQVPPAQYPAPVELQVPPRGPTPPPDRVQALAVEAVAATSITAMAAEPRRVLKKAICSPQYHARPIGVQGGNCSVTFALMFRFRPRM
jgi:hypothetical protein